MNPTDRIQQLEDWIQEDPKDPFLPYAVALEWQNQDKPQQALNRLIHVCDTFPDYLPAFQLRGQMLLELEKYTDAITILKQGLQLAKSQNNSKAQQEIQELINQTEYSDE